MSDLTPKEQEEAGVVAAILGGALARRVSQALRHDGVKDAQAIEAVALLCGAVSIPIFQTILVEDNALAALDEQEELERILEVEAK